MYSIYYIYSIYSIYSIYNIYNIYNISAGGGAHQPAVRGAVAAAGAGAHPAPHRVQAAAVRAADGAVQPILGEEVLYCTGLEFVNSDTN